eukprot:3565838-Pyramimonas_sp.AAC.1
MALRVDGRWVAREWRSLPLNAWTFVYLEANADLSMLTVALMHQSPLAATLPDATLNPSAGEEDHIQTMLPTTTLRT